MYLLRFKIYNICNERQGSQEETWDPFSTCILCILGWHMRGLKSPTSKAEPEAIQEVVNSAGGVQKEVLHALSRQENYP